MKNSVPFLKTFSSIADFQHTSSKIFKVISPPNFTIGHNFKGLIARPSSWLVPRGRVKSQKPSDHLVCMCQLWGQLTTDQEFIGCNAQKFDFFCFSSRALKTHQSEWKSFSRNTDFTSHWTGFKKHFKPEGNKRTGGKIIQCGSRPIS